MAVVVPMNFSRHFVAPYRTATSFYCGFFEEPMLGGERLAVELFDTVGCDFGG